MQWNRLETETERKARLAWSDAFWNRPSAEVMADLVVPKSKTLVARNGSVTVKPNVPTIQTDNVISLADWRLSTLRKKGLILNKGK
jgi:hypothetical protein